MKAPEADPGAVFEHALGTEVAPPDAEIAADHLGQPGLGDAISSGIRKFGTLFEIDHEIDSNAGIAGPSGMRRVSAVADEIARHDFSPCGFGCQSRRKLS